MKQIILTLAAIALLGNASPAQRGGTRGDVTPIPANCPLKVDFGSYAMGIDSGAYDAVQRLFARDRGVARVIRSTWGREGEVTLCAVTRSPADARRLAIKLRTLIPARPRGPVTVSGPGVKPYQAPSARPKPPVRPNRH